MASREELWRTVALNPAHQAYGCASAGLCHKLCLRGWSIAPRHACSTTRSNLCQYGNWMRYRAATTLLCCDGDLSANAQRGRCTSLCVPGMGALSSCWPPRGVLCLCVSRVSCVHVSVWLGSSLCDIAWLGGVVVVVQGPAMFASGVWVCVVLPALCVVSRVVWGCRMLHMCLCAVCVVCRA